MAKFARPNSYNGKQSNQNWTGQVRAANATEAAAGEDPSLYISPSTLASAVGDLVPSATTVVEGVVLLTDNHSPVATKFYADSLAIAGAPVSTETTAGIGQLATDAEAVARTASTGLLALFVTPTNLTPVLASPTAIGSTLPAAGTFTALTADGSAAVSLGANAASNFTVTGAFDLTLATTAGSIPISAGEAAADAISIQAAAGGLDVDTALLLSLRSSRNNASAIEVVATAGGIDISASGASAGEDIDIVATGSSVNITSTENAADSIVITSTVGGIDILASGASAGEDIDIIATGSSINITSTENASQSIYLHENGGASGQIELRADQGTGVDSVYLLSDVGGVTISGGLATADAINITASDAAGGIDVDAGSAGIAIDTSGAFVVTDTKNAAASIYLRANGGTSETVKIHADQGTGVASLDLLSDVGGITLTAGLATADAINLVASNAGGGIDIDSGTAGFIVDTTGAISLDAAAASNFTTTGAFDLTVQSTAGSVIISASEDVSDAIQILSTAGGMAITATGAAAQDIDITNNGGSVNVTATENAALAIYVHANGGTSETIKVHADQGTGVASIDILSDVGGITLTSGLGSGDAINIAANTAGGGIDIDSSTGGFIVDTTGAVSLDSALASNFTVTGAADLTLSSSAGAVNVTSGEANADSINVTSGGGMNIVATGAAAKDIIITNTNGSMTLTAGESAIDAMNLTAGGAASGINLTCGTNGILLSSGLKLKVTSVVTGVDSSPYALLGTDSFVGVDTGAGVMTITLPASPATGRHITVYDAGGAAAGSNITIDGNGKNIAAGGTSAGTKLINTAYESYILTYNGTLWLGQNIV